MAHNQKINESSENKSKEAWNIINSVRKSNIKQKVHVSPNIVNKFFHCLSGRNSKQF